MISENSYQHRLRQNREPQRKEDVATDSQVLCHYCFNPALNHDRLSNFVSSSIIRPFNSNQSGSFFSMTDSKYQILKRKLVAQPYGFLLFQTINEKLRTGQIGEDAIRFSSFLGDEEALLFNYGKNGSQLDEADWREAFSKRAWPFRSKVATAITREAVGISESNPQHEYVDLFRQLGSLLENYLNHPDSILLNEIEKLGTHLWKLYGEKYLIYGETPILDCGVWIIGDFPFFERGHSRDPDHLYFLFTYMELALSTERARLNLKDLLSDMILGLAASPNYQWFNFRKD